MRLSDFTASTHIPARLVRAVVKQFGGWDAFTQSAVDVADHGIDGGFAGFTYTRDTVAFYRRNRPAILELATQQADDFGIDAISLVAGFNCLNGGYTFDEVGYTLFGNHSRGVDTVANALAWYAAEEVCRAYADLLD